MSKPLTEVLAAIYVNEMHKQRQHRNYLGSAWEDLTDEDRAMAMAAMAEVVRFFNAFGVKVVLLPDGRAQFRATETKKQPSRPARTPRGTPRVPELSVTTRQILQKQMRPGYTGIPCEQCLGPNTVRSGKCLRCDDCGYSGECG